MKSNLGGAVENARQDLGDKASNLLDGASRQAANTRDGKAALNALQSETQETPKLGTSELLERVKDNFDTAARNVGEFTKDAGNQSR